MTHGPGEDYDEEIETSIKQLISKAITTDDVIDVFDAAGIKKPNIEILDERFLAEIMNMPRKNMAAELLKRLLKDEIKNRLRLNLIRERSSQNVWKRLFRSIITGWWILWHS